MLASESQIADMPRGEALDRRSCCLVVVVVVVVERFGAGKRLAWCPPGGGHLWWADGWPPVTRAVVRGFPRLWARGHPLVSGRA